MKNWDNTQFYQLLAEQTMDDIANRSSISYLEIEKFCEEHNIEIFDAHKKDFIYRFGQNKKSLDFPVNWGPFKNIGNSLCIKSERDDYALLDVFSVFFARDISEAYLIKNQWDELKLIVLGEFEHKLYGEKIKKFLGANNLDIKKAS